MKILLNINDTQTDQKLKEVKVRNRLLGSSIRCLAKNVEQLKKVADKKNRNQEALLQAENECKCLSDTATGLQTEVTRLTKEIV